jgi:uncharacterized protein (TIGR03435 family)
VVIPTIRTVLLALWCWVSAHAQPNGRPVFEVASVKPAPVYHGEDVTPHGGPGTGEPGQVTYPRTWLPTLVGEAYGVRFDQVSCPEWMKTEAYSIVAKIPPNTTKDQFKLMLRNLLADRFHLTLHHEPKVVPVYILSVAPDGPKLKPSPADATAPVEGASSEKDRFPPLQPGKTMALWWRDRAYYTYRQTMGEFAFGLGALVSISNGDGIVRGSPPMPFVVDETGLTGKFDFTLEFAGSPVPASPDAPRDGPTLSSALQRLGLKLEKGKRSVEFLAIDHADKVPTEN